MKLLLTGGHLTPALAMIDYLRATQPAVELVFVGRTHSRATQKAVEETEVTHRGVRFLPFTAPKFALKPWWQQLLEVPALLVSIWRAFWLITTEKPTGLLVFGGYLAVPVVIAAWLLRLPIITHEQTRVVGLANRLIGKLATVVAVTFAESNKFFETKKVVVTGNPLRPSVFQTNLAAPSWFHNPQHKPLLVVTGGSQGSQVINQVIDQLLPQLLTEWCVVHQRGEQANDRVPHAVGWYFPRVWLTDTELFWLWRQTACLTISRAGANTICELAVLRVPAILIPLPFAYQDEQKMNARWLADQGGAIVLEQAELTPAKLSSALRQLAKQATQMRAALGTTDLPLDGAERLWAVIQNQL